MRKRNIIREYPELSMRIERQVRFEEVDPIAYMWHGRYASWLEDGREAFGEKYNISYFRFHENNVAIPLKHFSLEYNHPLTYKNTYIIETSLLWNEAAIIEFDYKIFDKDERLMTTGKTIQMMIDLQGSLLIEAPKFYIDFCESWKQNAFGNIKC